MDKQHGRAAGQPEAVRLDDDPWYDTSAPEWGEWSDVLDGMERAAREQTPPAVPQPRSAAHDDVYLAVQKSSAFQEVRRRYRHFVLPATAIFLIWYLAYVIAATAAPGLMSRHVFGAVNVAMLVGLGQFASTFLLAWAYARHARRRRDRAALDIRWETQEMTRRNVR